MEGEEGEDEEGRKTESHKGGMMGNRFTRGVTPSEKTGL